MFIVEANYNKREAYCEYDSSSSKNPGAEVILQNVDKLCMRIAFSVSSQCVLLKAFTRPNRKNKIKQPTYSYPPSPYPHTRNVARAMLIAKIPHVHTHRWSHTQV